MKKKLSILHSKGRKPNWGILAPDTAYKKVPKLDNLISLLQEQYQFAEVVTVPTLERIPGKGRSSQSL